MRVFPVAIKALKLWQVSVMLGVFLGAAGITYGSYAIVSSSSEAGLSENQQLIPVQYGNLLNEVSTNGSIVFPNKETLTFDSQGTVGQVLVEEAQQVEEGQELARLDQTTIASLEKKVAEARITLRDAEDALTKAQDPHTELDIAEAEAKLANAQLSLKDAQDALDKLLTPTTQDIVKAEAAVASSTLALQNAQETLDELNPTVQDLAQAEAAVTSAKVTVSNAQEALDTVKNGPTRDEIAKAQSQVDSASTTLANARRDLSLVNKDWNAKLEPTHDSLNTTQEEYQDVFRKWLGIDPGEVQVDLDPDMLLSSWEIALESLFDPSARLNDPNLSSLTISTILDDLDTRWNEFVVYSWMNLTPGNVVATCDDLVVSFGTQCVKKELDDAWAALDEAIDNLDTMETQSAKAIASTEAAVTRAEEDLAGAEEDMADLLVDPDPLEVEDKEKQLALGIAGLQQAEDDLAMLKAGPHDIEMESARMEVTLAQADLDEAEITLSELGNPVLATSKSGTLLLRRDQGEMAVL